MKPALTADDLWPLVQKLTGPEQVRLAKAALRAASQVRDADVAAYVRDPVQDGEFSLEDDTLAWDSGGWDELDAAR